MAKIINKYCGLETTDNPSITIINIPSKSMVPGYVRFNVLEHAIKTDNYECDIRFKHSDKTREMGGLMLEAMTVAGKRISINIFNTGIYLINGGTTHEEIQYYADAVYKVVTETEGVLIKAPKELYSYKLGLAPDGRFIINTYLKGKLVT
jgi:TATA-box binding protein (TBP) (component of TFIID and TFIIIB)